ncbi:hypothetical protein [Eubacterium oxidoreducens]|uniref:Uncharacterized protein n=1 Tax=Eubacterium oxidoreducens TaxID=1732 RepID=A0A1G6AG26_EUBOX|nr:hypothetical protein [Eubacterium oxidoreducens]SDB07345.1 hypothetical protein SAMN02910417_00542 [Eubacterium oxidoreducens]
MDYEMIAALIVFIASLIGFLYGVVTIVVRRNALYLKMIALGIACIMISYFYFTLQLLTREMIPSGFNVGMLGLVGCFLFLLSANYGQMDSLADDGSKTFAKYRYISYVAPIVLAVVFVFAYMTSAELAKKISYTLVAAIVVAASRFHLKHIIFPDVDYGVIKCIRGYNMIALVLCAATIIMMVSDCAQIAGLYIVSNIIIAGCCVIVLPVLKREVAKWTI